MGTKTQQLTCAIQAIFVANRAEIDSLATTGKNGGTNAARIEGGSNYHNGTITRAANMSNMPVLDYWSGSAPTPSSALPACVQSEVLGEFNRIFGHVA